ncbi:MAG TPA: cellulase family glycosylhydrolase [Verrucomicrobiae bacterium]|nr:cellulase family glycosylhydrolase [Verrucomicrobiae bacterium]
MNATMKMIAVVVMGWMCLAPRSGHGEAARSHSTSRMEQIQVASDGKSFVKSPSGERFTPWGVNYDHDRSGRLLEYYWKNEWNTVAGDFAEMKELGANTVRIHLQVSRFMQSARKPNAESLKLLSRLIGLAETSGLYLDLTGLGCYDSKDVPAWFNALGEQERWAVQARFWEAVSRVASRSPAVFCYDLMNEPIVANGKHDDWTPGEFGGFHYTQLLTLDLAGRDPKAVAAEWVDRMTAAVRKHDKSHLITVGAIPWNLTWLNAQPVFYSTNASRRLDFVSVHFYPKSHEIPRALKALAAYELGKPIVVEEMFPLSCSIAELDRFIDGSKGIASGWISFYWGKTIREYQKEKRGIPDQVLMEWLENFKKKAPEMTGPAR